MSWHDELLIGFDPGAACRGRAAARIAAAAEAVTEAVAGGRTQEVPVADRSAARFPRTRSAPGIPAIARTSGARR